ncbi:hypothetical protein PISMIDRAFT_370942 [Pisolithus microcarpus 441]|uniref:Unplaced genomic scaffold scaffold_282, whole genome shotgun sequence n=1 Tax=Pisolithus microcarpus 441 TaxID=765257 RepID=A0A0C9XNC2_9AGAM|nr:hypothetical protein BKA83DRAFT_370942 [Pisolithus microcarpus]KIK13935.1 hypothetical protein PISMIDRAFT_370942 [Pisolithus microcarpus 441]
MHFHTSAKPPCLSGYRCLLTTDPVRSGGFLLNGTLLHVQDGFPPLADIGFVPVLLVASFAECHSASWPRYPRFVPSVEWEDHLHDQPLSSTTEASALRVTWLDFGLAERLAGLSIILALSYLLICSASFLILVRHRWMDP